MDSPVVVLCSRLVISVGRESLSHYVTCLMVGMTRLFMLSWMVSLTSILTTAEKLNETDKVAMMIEMCGGLNRID